MVVLNARLTDWQLLEKGWPTGSFPTDWSCSHIKKPSPAILIYYCSLSAHQAVCCQSIFSIHPPKDFIHPSVLCVLLPICPCTFYLSSFLCWVYSCSFLLICMLWGSVSKPVMECTTVHTSITGKHHLFKTVSKTTYCCINIWKCSTLKNNTPFLLPGICMAPSLAQNKCNRNTFLFF